VSKTRPKSRTFQKTVHITPTNWRKIQAIKKETYRPLYLILNDALTEYFANLKEESAE